jgi:murein L,D-transpeptidase YafK
MNSPPAAILNVSGKLMATIKKLIIISIIAILAGLIIYYFLPIQKLPDNVTIDRIVVLKSEHKLIAYSHGQIIVTYKIAIGKNPTGDKEYEGDGKTPEGIYTINDKNPKSEFHKNLGVSYPNTKDILQAQKLGKPVGGSIKIHGLKNGKGYIGKFQR